MIEFLFLIVCICITFLVADYRRHLEIQDIKSSHEDEMDLAFDSGYKHGHLAGLLEMRRIMEDRYGLTPTE